MKLLFFDLETTGFGFDKCAIIQLAGVMAELEVDGSLKPLDAINLKMKPRPGKMIDQRALEVNGYDVNTIMSFQDDREAYRKLIAFLDKYVDKYDTMSKVKLVGYNSLHFDNDFLRQWFADNNDNFFGSYFWSDGIDVMSEASRYLVQYRPIMNNFKLGNVAAVLGIDLNDKALHDGLYDVKTTFKVFKKIISAGEMFMPFDEETATRIFNEQQASKDRFKRPKSRFTEETAWLTA